MKRRRPWAQYLATSVAAGAAAAAGSIAVDPGSDWYRRLAKPAWQPPSWAFGPVWTGLYASIAWSGGRALNRAADADRRRYISGARSPAAGLAGITALNVSNLVLIRRTARIDPKAAAALLPYAIWTGFASVLNADILRRNIDRT